MGYVLVMLALKSACIAKILTRLLEKVVISMNFGKKRDYRRK